MRPNLVRFPLVDVDRFLRELPRELADVSRFQAVLDDVPGLAKANNLALLNVAARCLDAGEMYLEVGTFRGTSLVSAMLGNDGEFVALDNWSMAEGSREQLDANLERYELQATIVEGDAFESLRNGVPSPIGAYYYDNGHEYEQQVEGLRLAEPYLASPALLIVDDTDWEKVERAVDDYLAQEPRATEIFRADGERSRAARRAVRAPASRSGGRARA
jgi:predicted O-methyltransferase YrrM